jgi:metal-responsive CopG/Arc/MetJ family transcriptional regulator
MKTAISIPDTLFQAAEQFARRMGMSRSELYAHAIEQYLQAHRDEGITAALDAIYQDTPSKIDPALAKAETRAVSKDRW